MDHISQEQERPSPAKNFPRVVRRSIIIKDHYLGRSLLKTMLRFMDWVGNQAHGVVLPYNFWPEERGRAAGVEMRLRPVTLQRALGLYPWPLNILFEQRLHFLVKLVK